MGEIATDYYTGLCCSGCMVYFEKERPPQARHRHAKSRRSS